LTENLRSRIENKPAESQLVYLNRLLLEEAYPFALAKCRKPYRLVVQPKDGFKGPEQKQHLTDPPPDDVLVVYKIHGSFSDPGSASDKDPSDVVLTEEDYIRFLTVIGQPGAGVPNYVSAKLVHSRLLFLGYSLEDWDFRTLYKGLIETLPRDDLRTAFAIQWHPPKFWVDYWEAKHVVIYDYDIYRFAEELEARYKARFGTLRAVKN
jgi:SIR2-like protein